jgi:hypothetical protein
MKPLIEMLMLQQQLNDETNGEGWEQGINRHGKPIDWRRCIYLECAELIDSYPWKHWKAIGADPDWENIRIEAVDIWHFVMSEILRLNAVEGRQTIETLAQTIASQKSFGHFAKEEMTGARKPHQETYEAHIRHIEILIERLFCRGEIEEIIDAFLIVAAQSGLTLSLLYRLYIGKNILNRFRQDHGYKEGHYLKEWNGEEDNAVMQRLLSEAPQITPDALYRKLSEAYRAT